MASTLSNLKPILKKSGQIMIEDVPELVMYKPCLIPLKSYTLEKLEKMQQNAKKYQEQSNENIKE